MTRIRLSCAHFVEPTWGDSAGRQAGRQTLMQTYTHAHLQTHRCNDVHTCTCASRTYAHLCLRKCICSYAEATANMGQRRIGNKADQCLRRAVTRVRSQAVGLTRDPRHRRSQDSAVCPWSSSMGPSLYGVIHGRPKVRPETRPNTGARTPQADVLELQVRLPTPGPEKRSMAQKGNLGVRVRANCLLVKHWSGQGRPP